MPRDPLAREEAETSLRSMTGIISISFVLFFVVSISTHGVQPGFWEVTGLFGVPTGMVCLPLTALKFESLQSLQLLRAQRKHMSVKFVGRPSEGM